MRRALAALMWLVLLAVLVVFEGVLLFAAAYVLASTGSTSKVAIDVPVAVLVLGNGWLLSRIPGRIADTLLRHLPDAPPRTDPERTPCCEATGYQRVLRRTARRGR